MFKIILLVCFFIVVASGQYLGSGIYNDYGAPAYHHHGSAPSLHGPFASSTNTGIRRYGSTAGYVAAAPAYVAAAPAYIAAGHGYAGHGAYYL